MFIADKIRAVRLEKGLTQKQLGEKCGMSESTLRQYEIGYRNPKIETIKKIANALAVPYTLLLVGNTNEETTKLSEIRTVILDRINYLVVDWESALAKADYIKAHDDQVLLTELNMILKLLR